MRVGMGSIGRKEKAFSEAQRSGDRPTAFFFASGAALSVASDFTRIADRDVHFPLQIPLALWTRGHK